MPSSASTSRQLPAERETPSGDFDLSSEDIAACRAPLGVVPSCQISIHEATTRKLLEPLGPTPVADLGPLLLRKRRGGQHPMVVSAILVGVTIGTVALWDGGYKRLSAAISSNARQSTGSQSPAATALTPTRETFATPHPESPRPTEPEPPKKIQLQIQVAPKTAILTLDGHVVTGNLLQAEAPQDRSLHVLQASAPGFVSHNQVLTFTDNIELKVELRRSPQVAQTKEGLKPRRMEPTSRSFRARVERPDEPGMDMPHASARRIPRTIDERDPYAP